MGILAEGSYFGEISLINSCAITASIVSCTHATVAAISKQKFFDLPPKFIASLNEKTYDYKDNVKKLRFKLLKQVEWIGNSTAFDQDSDRLKYLINSISFNLEDKIYLAGTHIIEENDHCHSIIFVLSGKVSI